MSLQCAHCIHSDHDQPRRGKMQKLQKKLIPLLSLGLVVSIVNPASAQEVFDFTNEDSGYDSSANSYLQDDIQEIQYQDPDTGEYFPTQCSAEPEQFLVDEPFLDALSDPQVEAEFEASFDSCEEKLAVDYVVLIEIKSDKMKAALKDPKNADLALAVASVSPLEIPTITGIPKDTPETKIRTNAKNYFWGGPGRTLVADFKKFGFLRPDDYEFTFMRKETHLIIECCKNLSIRFPRIR